ncbi:hypothetical protein EJB05_08564, partial [Eragrostis curvula]
MDVITKPKGGGQVSSTNKASKVSKDASSKSSAQLVRNVSSSSSADVSKSNAPEKAKIQDKDVVAPSGVPDVSGSNAKIQDKIQGKGLEVSSEAKIQDKDGSEATASGCLSLCSMAELHQIVANLGPLSDRSRFQLPDEPHVHPRDILSPSASGELFVQSVFETIQEEFLDFDVNFDSAEITDGPLLACDEVPPNTFVMTALLSLLLLLPKGFIFLVWRTIFCCLTVFFFLFQSLAITHASLRQYRELSQMKLSRDLLRSDLSALESNVKEKEEVLVLSEKRVADLSSEKESLCKSAEDFKTKVSSLERQIEELDTSLAKAKESNKDLREKVDATARENDALVNAERLRLSGLCDQIKDALISVGTIPDQLAENASVEHCQAWLSTNVPYVVKACKTFSTNVVHLVVRDLLYSLEVGWSDALAKAVCDSSFVSTEDTPDPLVEALIKFSSHIHESFWSRVSAIGQQPQDEDLSDVSLSEFSTPKLPSGQSARHEPPIEVYSSPSEIHLSSDSDPLSTVEGSGAPFTFPPGSLVAIGRVFYFDSNASEGRRSRGRRGSRGRRSRGDPSSNRSSTRKKRGGRGRRSSSVEFEDSSLSFDAASQVERIISSGVVGPVFRKPYSLRADTLLMKLNCL